MLLVQFVELGPLPATTSLLLIVLIILVGEIALQLDVRRRLRRVDVVVGHDGTDLGPELHLPPKSRPLIRGGVGRGDRRAGGGRAGETEGAPADDGPGSGQHDNLFVKYNCTPDNLPAVGFLGAL